MFIRAYLLKFSCQPRTLSYYVASIVAKTKSSLLPPDKRIRNVQTTTLLPATACYFHPKYCLDHKGHYKIVPGRGELGVTDSSNHINSTRKTDVSVTNLKCLSDFCHSFYFDDKSRDKQEITD